MAGPRLHTTLTSRNVSSRKMSITALIFADKRERFLGENEAAKARESMDTIKGTQGKMGFLRT